MKPPPKPSPRRKTANPTLADAGKCLRAEDKEALVGMILDWAKEDERLRERLILYAARRAGPDAAALAVRRAFQSAVRARDYVSYREASAWARDVDAAIDSIEQLIDDGHGAAAIGLCESALQSLLEAIQFVDDSGGHFSELRDRLQDIHYRACQEILPDPVSLAGRLFRQELQSDFDVFSGAAERYAEVLGPEGLKAYRDLAEAEWAKVPARNAANRRPEDPDYFRITHIMESLARASGDIEELTGVMSRDLSSGYRYLRIAEVFREARRRDRALEWAEKGLKAFPERTDSRLREFAAEEYHRLGRHTDAMALIWAVFLDRPFLETYSKLAEHAKKAGSWPEWRESALAEIRRRIAQNPRSDRSVLVEIFLSEGKADPSQSEAAWREAVSGGCSGSLWLRLAADREKEHPEDAAPIYLRYAEAGIAATANGRYEDSVNLLVKAAALMKRMGRAAEFAGQLEALRSRYKAKRNFMKLLEQKKSSL
jgi:tetratricopeptide (TPR) repeat protein